MPSVNSFKSHFNLGLRSISIFDESRQIGSNQEFNYTSIFASPESKSFHIQGKMNREQSPEDKIHTQTLPKPTAYRHDKGI